MPKLDHLSLSVKLHDPHVICITESWLCKNISDDELSLSGYQLFRLDRDRHGGGVLVYVSLLFSVTLHPLPPPSLELISFSIHLNKIQFCICVFYRPPNSPRCIFDTLSSYLVSICANNFHNFILLGDFNVNFDNVSHPLYSNLCNVSTMFNMSQSVDWTGGLD